MKAISFIRSIINNNNKNIPKQVFNAQIITFTKKVSRNLPRDSLPEPVSPLAIRFMALTLSFQHNSVRLSTDLNNIIGFGRHSSDVTFKGDFDFDST